jgi:hypothetical protein
MHLTAGNVPLAMNRSTNLKRTLCKYKKIAHFDNSVTTYAVIETT